jgi:hypothetical protein
MNTKARIRAFMGTTAAVIAILSAWGAGIHAGQPVNQHGTAGPSVAASTGPVAGDDGFGDSE